MMKRISALFLAGQLTFSGHALAQTPDLEPSLICDQEAWGLLWPKDKISLALDQNVSFWGLSEEGGDIRLVFRRAKTDTENRRTSLPLFSITPSELDQLIETTAAQQPKDSEGTLNKAIRLCEFLKAKKSLPPPRKDKAISAPSRQLAPVQE